MAKGIERIIIVPKNRYTPYPMLENMYGVARLIAWETVMQSRW